MTAANCVVCIVDTAPAGGERHADRLQSAHHRSADRTGQPGADRYGRGGAGLRLRHDQRPHHGTAQSAVEVSLYRDRRIPGGRLGRVARAADHHGLRRRADEEASLRPFGHGGAAPPGRADRQGAVHHRLHLQGPPDLGHRCRLVPRGVRGHRRRPVRRSRQRDRRMDGRMPGALVRRGAEIQRQVCELRRCGLHAQAGAEADSDLGGRGKRAGAAPHRPLCPRLVSGRHEPAAPDEHGLDLQAGAGTLQRLLPARRPRSQGDHAGLSGPVRPGRASPRQHRGRARTVHGRRFRLGRGYQAAEGPRRQLGRCAAVRLWPGADLQGTIDNMHRFRDGVLSRLA